MPEAAHRYGKRLIYENPSFEVPPARGLELLGRDSTGEITTIDIRGAYPGPESRSAGVRRLFDGARYRRLFVECLRDYLAAKRSRFSFRRPDMLLPWNALLAVCTSGGDARTNADSI
ncbi:MAG: hypothetical protein IJ321_00985 [Alistipes sp.]|uniref:hypothetical protein n=1 Tax=Alistipes sp. TaxID=1872444 RepID=UPI0023F0EBF3|nr:hypothetical protein [Alistipes sp.]MBQ7892500.1 hypothetical protein [Alistipes sp.]